MDNLPQCEKCKKRWHLAQDCRKQQDSSKNPIAKKTFRKKFVKKGRVNNTVGRSVNFYDDEDYAEPWIGTVFSVIGSEEEVSECEHVVVVNEPYLLLKYDYRTYAIDNLPELIAYEDASFQCSENRSGEVISLGDNSGQVQRVKLYSPENPSSKVI